jgi:hypothetical protein
VCRGETIVQSNTVEGQSNAMESHES